VRLAFYNVTWLSR